MVRDDYLGSGFFSIPNTGTKGKKSTGSGSATMKCQTIYVSLTQKIVTKPLVGGGGVQKAPDPGSATTMEK